jgi:hypothetical protein
MDSFERLTGFREEYYEATRAKLRVLSLAAMSVVRPGLRPLSRSALPTH